MLLFFEQIRRQFPRTNSLRECWYRSKCSGGQSRHNGDEETQKNMQSDHGESDFLCLCLTNERRIENYDDDVRIFTKLSHGLRCNLESRSSQSPSLLSWLFVTVIGRFSLMNITMGRIFSREKANVVKGSIKEVVNELPKNLASNDINQGSVTVGYDPSKMPENANDKPERKPINEKFNNIIKNKYPQGSVMMVYDPWRSFENYISSSGWRQMNKSCTRPMILLNMVSFFAGS